MAGSLGKDGVFSFQDDIFLVFTHSVEEVRLYAIQSFVSG
jgi:hypothetical protein